MNIHKPLGAAVAILFAFAASAEDRPGLLPWAQVDSTKLTQETQRLESDSDSLVLVWWLPPEYWAVTLSSSGTITPQQTQAVMNLLRPYVLLAVVDADVGPLGGLAYHSPSEIREQIRLADRHGNQFASIPDSDIGPDLRNLTATLRPIFANTLGPMGENINFYFFPGRNPEGEPLADAARAGGFSVSLHGESLRWRLPLGSLLRPKICPTDGESLSGAWSYCPWHGKKLVVR